MLSSLLSHNRFTKHHRVKQEASESRKRADEATSKLSTCKAELESKHVEYEISLRKTVLMVKQLKVTLHYGTHPCISTPQKRYLYNSEGHKCPFDRKFFRICSHVHGAFRILFSGVHVRRVGNCVHGEGNVVSALTKMTMIPCVTPVRVFDRFMVGSGVE